MSHPLDGARLKVVRAQEHLDSLNAEIAMFLKQHPYTFTVKPDGKYQRVAPAPREQPPLRLSTIIGDCLGNARAALDYIVWELATTFGKPPIDTWTDRERKQVQMPIYDDPSAKGLAENLNRLAEKKIPATAIQHIRDIQPNNRGYEPLGWLHALSNDDKHRMPLLTISEIESAEIVIMLGNIRTVTSGRQAAQGVNLDTMGMPIDREQVQVDSQASLYVAFADSGVPPIPVDAALDQIIKCVANVVPRFEPIFNTT